MDKPAPKLPPVREVLDWMEVQKYLDYISGRKIRHWSPDSGENEDYWHVVMHCFSPMRNDYFTIERDELLAYDKRPFVQEITDLLFEHFGTGQPRIEFYLQF